MEKWESSGDQSENISRVNLYSEKGGDESARWYFFVWRAVSTSKTSLLSFRVDERSIQTKLRLLFQIRYSIQPKTKLQT